MYCSSARDRATHRAALSLFTAGMLNLVVAENTVQLPSVGDHGPLFVHADRALGEDKKNPTPP
jgi:hypothetical protein